MLVHLRWLDLPLTTLQRLQASMLGKLEDLSLFNNHISVIQSLDNNTNPGACRSVIITYGRQSSLLCA